ncbi:MULTISPECIES: molybdate ABC transporter substrate-binding protein [Clostridium]|uniref:Molybdate ABC transporter substrate-binding protein n=1 Tax=Clostridium cibarium TaxID=2762247 RepID=A0ABR8PQ67_9CLOT|nr:MULTISPECIES: molybdate ABC transporter substrate-binding protein [Clostridium]MBD7910302.1 molybdate ABC transporter substrate-binding protein [Clostridium cibarium]
MKKLIKFLSLLIILILPFSSISCSNKKITASASIELNISAAASLKEAMADLEKSFKEVNPNVTLVTNFGASGSLEQQIEQGAPCDVFISAGKSQMKQLKDKGLLIDSSDKDLIKNELVLVGPKDSKITGINDLTSDIVKKIAVGEASSVPAGKYADEVFTKLNIKTSLQPKLVFAKDVKEVLSWVISSNAEVGFVYLSDALSNDSVKIIEQIPSEYHSPINYPVGIINTTKNQYIAKEFENFLFTDKAQKIFKKYGYKSVN